MQKSIEKFSQGICRIFGKDDAPEARGEKTEDRYKRRETRGGLFAARQGGIIGGKIYFLPGGVEVRYSLVIWDWNGTLFDDAAWCVRVMNRMLVKRGIPPLSGIDAYHRAFCFPVKEYYRNVGFDFSKESFADLVAEFIALYHANKTGQCRLHENTETTLKALHQRHIPQIILSASQKDNLLSQLGDFDITNYFDEILGLSDIYAKSKIDIGLDYIARKGAGRAVLIGDTGHDVEVAAALGADCLLIAGGHQSKEDLLLHGMPVLDDISQVPDYIF